MRRFTLIASLTLLGLSGCSSDSSSSGTSTAGSVPVTDAATAATETTGFDAESAATTMVDDTMVDDTMVDNTMVDNTMVDDTEPSGPSEGAGSEFCQISQEINDADFPLDDTATPADIEFYFTEFFPDAVERLEGAVPPELADDVDLLIEVSFAFGAVFEANDWDIEATFTDPALEEVFANPEYEAAGDRVDAYCGL